VLFLIFSWGRRAACSLFPLFPLAIMRCTRLARELSDLEGVSFSSLLRCVESTGGVNLLYCTRQSWMDVVG
jgi:hypothetical protein